MDQTGRSTSTHSKTFLIQDMDNIPGSIAILVIPESGTKKVSMYRNPFYRWIFAGLVTDGI